MHFNQIKNGDITVELINTSEKLKATALKLSTLSVIGFDTEFDRFRREYGFKLSLLQIFDGEICYLIDPIEIRDLSPLWPIFNNENILKILYAGSEDIQILKLNGCNPKNIYDLQIAGNLANHPSNSFATLVQAECDIVVNKSLQESNWRKRPLTTEQLLYASNDVIHLIELYNILQPQILERNMNEALKEEHQHLEAIVVTEFVVKLNDAQKKSYSDYFKTKLLALFELRNTIAKSYNMPPCNIVADGILEQILKNLSTFIDVRDYKGFSRKILEDDANILNFNKMIKSIDIKESILPTKNYTYFSNEEKQNKIDMKANADIKFFNISRYMQPIYGEKSTEFLLRGFRKGLQAMPFVEIPLRRYQKSLIEAASLQLNISLNS